MSAWTDEQLSAYLDAALPEAQCLALEADLVNDADLKTRLAHLAEADAAIKAAFDAPMHEPAPAALLAVVAGDEPQAQAGAVVAFPGARARQSRALDWRLPLAASLVLALGGVGGYSIGQQGAGHYVARLEAGIIDAANPLAQLLAETPSQRSVRLDANATLTPILSFAAGDGRLCREFEINAGESASVGVACLKETGWRIEAMLASAPRASSANGYAPASGVNTRALDAVLDGLGAGEAMSAADEAAMIKQNWRR